MCLCLCEMQQEGKSKKQRNACVWDQISLYANMKKTSVSVWVKNSVSLKRWWCHISTEEKTSTYKVLSQTNNIKTKLYGTKIGPSHYNQHIF